MELLKRNEEMRDFFNEKADGYDDVHLKMMDNKIAITSCLPEKIERVLDLGAGTGLELIPLFERFPQAHVTVVDISAEMLKTLAQRPFAGQVETLCGDFFLLDFGGPYDAVISSAALHHFTEEDKNVLYGKIFACLKSGGVFVNSDRCFDTLAQQEENFKEYETNGHNYRHFDTPLCKEVEKRTLEGAGFVDFSVDDMPDGRYKVMRAVKPR